MTGFKLLILLTNFLYNSPHRETWNSHSKLWHLLHQCIQLSIYILFYLAIFKTGFQSIGIGPVRSALEFGGFCQPFYSQPTTGKIVYSELGIFTELGSLVQTVFKCKWVLTRMHVRSDLIYLMKSLIKIWHFMPNVFYNVFCKICQIRRIPTQHYIPNTICGFLNMLHKNVHN
jgi:hypothetical protein